MENYKTSSNKSFGIVFFIVFLIISVYPLINDGDIRLWSLFISLIFAMCRNLRSDLGCHTGFSSRNGVLNACHLLYKSLGQEAIM